MSSLFISGARYSNYGAWIADPFTSKPSAQIAYTGDEGLVDVLNGLSGAGTLGLRVTSGIFEVWRAAGITTHVCLFGLSVATLALGMIFFVAGWYHFHVAVPSDAWFNDSDAILSHHLTAVVGLGCIAWTGHLIHVAIPTDSLLRLGVDPCGICTASLSLASSAATYYPTEASGNLMTLEWGYLQPYLTVMGGLNPTSGSLWLTDVAHHHFAVGIPFHLPGLVY